MVWYTTFDAIFWMTLAGGILGLIALIVKSKCRSFSICWGGLIIERDIAAEIELEEFRVNNANKGPMSPRNVIQDNNLINASNLNNNNNV